MYKNKQLVQTGKQFKSKHFLHGEKYIFIFQQVTVMK